MKHLSKSAVLALGVLLATAPVAAASGTELHPRPDQRSGPGGKRGPAPHPGPHPFQPLTILWTVLGLILVFTALRGRRLKRTIKHPYADQAPMSIFTDLAPLQVRPDSLGPADAEASSDVSERPRGRRTADDERGQAGTFRPAEGGHVEAAFS